MISIKLHSRKKKVYDISSLGSFLLNSKDLDKCNLKYTQTVVKYLQQKYCVIPDQELWRRRIVWQSVISKVLSK